MGRSPVLLGPLLLLCEREAPRSPWSLKMTLRGQVAIITGTIVFYEREVDPGLTTFWGPF